MKTQFPLEQKFRVSPWTWAILTACLFGIAIACFGQDTNKGGGAWAANMAVPMAQTPAPAPVPDALPIAPANAGAEVEQGLTASVIRLAEQYPMIATLLMIIGALRFIIKPIMTGLRWYAQGTETKADDALLDKVEHSALYTAFLFLVDWLASIKVKPPTAAKAARVAAVICLLSSVICLLTACATTPAPVGQIGAGVDSQGNVSNVTGGLTWDATTNVNVTVNGNINPATGEWSSNLLITFKTPPDVTVQQLATKACAYVRKGEVTSYVLQYDSANRDHRLFIRESQLKGALISGLK